MTATGAFLVRDTKGLNLLPCAKNPHREHAVPRGVVGFLYSEPSRRDHWVAPECNLAEMTSYLGTESLEGTTHSVRDEDFSKLSKRFAETVGRSTNPLTFLIDLGEIGVPIMTAKTLRLLQTSDFHYRSTIADLLFLKDLNGIEALVHVNRKKGDTAPIELPSWLEGVRWLTRKWFACSSIDGAMTIKMASPSATIIELSP